MMKRFVAILLMLAILSVNSAAVPNDLWEEDKRVESIFTSDGAAREFDIIQKLLGYIGLIDTETLNTGEPTDRAMFLKGFGAVVIGKDADSETIKEMLESLGMLRDGINFNNLTMNDAIYTAGRVSGYIRKGQTFNDGLNSARRNGILRNITFRNGERITQGEFVQLLYNTISVQLYEPDYYTAYSESYMRNEKKSILELQYGIALKKGIVTSVYGESLYPANTITEDEICIDDIVYKCSSTASEEPLLGREINCFVETEDNRVVLAEPTDKNEIKSFESGASLSMRSDGIVDADEKIRLFGVGGTARLIYNGVFVGTYEKGLAERYYSEDCSVTLINNDGTSGYDVVLIEKYLSYPIAEVGADGTVRFKYEMKYNGKRFFETVPKNNDTHVILTRNGSAATPDSIAAGGIISIAENISGAAVTYTRVKLDMQKFSGKLESIKKGNIYKIDGEEYRVSELLLDAQKNYYEIEQPQTGEEYTFTIDCSGQVVDVEYSRTYNFGYIVRAGAEETIDGSSATLKIFTESGEMKLFGLSKKPVVHIGGDNSGVVMSRIGAVDTITGTSADYRTLIQYETNSNGEIKEIWLPFDNTAGEVGQLTYPLTKDFVAPVNTTYYFGVLAHKYMCTGIPVFVVPKNMEGDDSFYTIRSMDYRGSSVQTNEQCTLYSIDKYYKAKAAVMTTDESAIFSGYQNWIIVESVGMFVGTDGYIQYGVNGWQNGAYVTVPAESVDLEAYSNGLWYDDVMLSELLPGDIIEARRVSGRITDFRVIFRPSEPRETRMQNGNGNKVNWGAGHWALSMAYGILKEKKDDILMIDIAGDVRPHYMHTNVAYYLINPARSNLQKISASEIHEGDTVVLQKNWGKTRNVYIYREN